MQLKSAICFPPVIAQSVPWGNNNQIWQRDILSEKNINSTPGSTYSTHTVGTGLVLAWHELAGCLLFFPCLDGDVNHTSHFKINKALCCGTKFITWAPESRFAFAPFPGLSPPPVCISLHGWKLLASSSETSGETGIKFKKSRHLCTWHQHYYRNIHWKTCSVGQFKISFNSTIHVNVCKVLFLFSFFLNQQYFFYFFRFIFIYF